MTTVLRVVSLQAFGGPTFDHPCRPERGLISYRRASVITAKLGATIACSQSDREYALS